jgi:ribonuclease HI
MTIGFTCRQCGREFTVPSSVLARYPGWTPPLCSDCRRPATRSLSPPPGGARRSTGAGPQTGLFTDGCCEGNPGPGGWGLVKVVDGAVIEEACGASPDTTNNRMELTALIEAMRRLRPDEESTVYTDSALCANTINLWAPTWKKQGWTRGPKRQPIANLDLVRELFDLAEAHPRAKIEWIKGHAGYTWNEYADRLAAAYQSKRG